MLTVVVNVRFTLFGLKTGEINGQIVARGNLSTD